MPSNIDMERMAKIGHDAQTHPQDAMAQVPMLPDVAMQARAYIDIARTTMKKDSATAHSALRKAVDLLPKINLEQKPRTATEIAGLYERMGDKESAKSAVEKSMDIVSEVYKQDADPEDPNKAPKWFWPSTAAWRSSMVVATRLDPAWASGLLKDIPDDDIRALNQLAIASETLKIPMRLVEVMELHKDSARMMISQED